MAKMLSPTKDEANGYSRYVFFTNFVTASVDERTAQYATGKVWPSLDFNCLSKAFQSSAPEKVLFGQICFEPIQESPKSRVEIFLRVVFSRPRHDSHMRVWILSIAIPTAALHEYQST
jgi:hypothetical protein